MFVASYITNIGKTSNNQEDSVLFANNVIQSNMKKPVTKNLSLPALLAVSDGIAGLKYGEVASSMVLENLLELYKNNLEEKSIIEIIRGMQDRLTLYTLNYAKYYGMGATLAGSIFDKESVKVFNVGDSRVYLFRDGVLKQLSVDHTVAKKMQERGEILSSEDCAHAYKMLDSAIVATGESDDFEIHTISVSPKIGDIFLICTDGVTDMVDEEKLCTILNKNESLDKLSQSIYKEAMKNGGKDNLSLIVASYTNAYEN